MKVVSEERLRPGLTEGSDNMDGEVPWLPLMSCSMSHTHTCIQGTVMLSLTQTYTGWDKGVKVWNKVWGYSQR
jgi:hypothetical protein